jgi:hypothetical protein
MPECKRHLVDICTAPTALAVLSAVALTAGCATTLKEPPLTKEQQQANLASFDYVWTTIRDKHFDPELGGLKDLGRAHIVGSRTAGAALPSIIERLPNGDGFQYAVANYVSKGGEVLEGIGVMPDVEVIPTREALLQGKDPVCEAAIAWIRDQE